MMTARVFLFLGSLGAALAVALGAFGAHALKVRLSADMLTIYQTGVQYHLWHALGLVLVGVVALQFPGTALLRWSGWLMVTGVVLFSGSLYALSLTGIRGLGAITPLGGIAFVAAWLLFAIAAWRIS